MIRIAIKNTDKDHADSAPFTWRRFVDDELAELLGHGDELTAAKALLTQAQQEYPESDGYEAWLERAEPDPKNEGDLTWKKIRASAAKKEEEG